MEPNLHLSAHHDRVAAAVTRHRQHMVMQPRAPGPGREQIAVGLRRLADRLDARPAPARHA